MSNDRNKILDRKATKILALIHNYLAGPIQPLAKDGYKYLMYLILLQTILVLQCYIS